MINVNELNAYLGRKGWSKARAAREIGVVPRTFYEWLNNESMPTDKAEILIKKLSIDNPTLIFFDGRLPVKQQSIVNKIPSNTE